MYYKLKRDYMLRGWKLLPTGVINRETRDFKFLPLEKYKVLILCDGQNDSESAIFDDEQRKIMEELCADCFVEAKDTPSPLEAVQEYKFYDNRFMKSVHWAITGKCNCKCRHCYMSAPQHKVEEFTHEQCLDIIAQMAACGIQTVSLTGGEALIRKDFWEIIDALTAADIKITMIYSNGLLINEKFCAELERRHLRIGFQISFDGLNGCHDWLRGGDGVEKLTLRAIKLLCERNFPVSVAIDLHKGNLFAFRETVKTLADLGAKFLIVGTIDESGEAFGMSDKILTTDELFTFVLSYIPQYIEDGAPVPLSLAGIFNGINTSEYKITIARHYEDKNYDNRCLCGLIRKSMHIDFNGVAMPCPPMGLNDACEKYFAPIFDKPLKELLNDGDYMNFIDLRLGDYFKKNPTCAVCEYKNRCASGCPANSIADSGELLGIDKKTCKFFKEGYYDRVVAIAEKLNLKRLGA